MINARYRSALPQLSGQKMLTDGGLETGLIFHQGLDLPLFAAFDLLRTKAGQTTLTDYYRPYIQLALDHGSGFILEAPTWRASRDWADKLGYSAGALEQVNRDAIDILAALADEYERPGSPMVISGNIGPRGDGYAPGAAMTVDEAEAYHSGQIRIFAGTPADMVTAMTMNYLEEALGITRAAAKFGMPVVIGFTVETDGRLPTGQSLGEAIGELDRLADVPPAYYMINCAHPSHFGDAVMGGELWTRRIHGLRANASRKSHAELDNSDTLDDGNPAELGRDYGGLMEHLPNLRVFGGCCGTDHRHIAAIAETVCA